MALRPAACQLPHVVAVGQFEVFDMQLVMARLTSEVVVDMALKPGEPTRQRHQFQTQLIGQEGSFATPLRDK